MFFFIILFFLLFTDAKLRRFLATYNNSDVFQSKYMRQTPVSATAMSIPIRICHLQLFIWASNSWQIALKSASLVVTSLLNFFLKLLCALPLHFEKFLAWFL